VVNDPAAILSVARDVLKRPGFGRSASCADSETFAVLAGANPTDGAGHDTPVFCGSVPSTGIFQISEIASPAWISDVITT
jgi:hypothetical protein